MSRIDLYNSIVPSFRQKKAQRYTFNAFIHYGLNTFTGKEWGDGKVPPSKFNPTSQDTDQWVSAIKSAGIGSIILTCKHHDGFCLWQTATTTYSVASSPYKNGKGDVVREVSDSCKKFGLQFGIYLSPWDRNHETYATPKYNDVYCAQLTELLTQYGDIFCVWLDGACGAHMDGKEKQVYDFERYFQIVRKYQPMAVISGCGPDIRWVGNEGGFARESEWNVVPQFACDIQTIEKNSQQSENQNLIKKGADIVMSDLGSRKFLADFNKFMWYPAEVDVSIRPGWFYHKAQDLMVRSVENLLRIYYTSVGGNSFLLLNLPPDTRGLIHEEDVSRLKQIGEHLARSEGDRVPIIDISAPKCQGENAIKNVLSSDYDPKTYEPLGYYTPNEVAATYKISLAFATEQRINRVKLVENSSYSQRVESFNIYATCGGKHKLIYNGTTIGFGRIAVFKAIVADGITIEINSCRDKPYIEHIAVYRDNGYKLKTPAFHKLKLWVHRKNYEIYIARENKNQG